MDTPDSYLTIRVSAESEIKRKGSKFIGRVFSSESENMFELNFKNNDITFERIHFFKFSNNLFLIKNGKLRMNSCIVNNNNKNSANYIDIYNTDEFRLKNCKFFANNLTNISIKNDFENVITENCDFIK